MGYCLEAGETLHGGLQRIILEQVDEAILSLQNTGDAPHEAIHEARKSFKKIRAALRLLRAGMDRDQFRRENATYRDAGRALAPLRDSYVRVQLVGAGMMPAVRNEGPAATLASRDFPDTYQRLLDAHNALNQRLLHDEEIPAQVIAHLQGARPRIAALAFDRSAGATLQQSLRRVYRRGRRAMARAYEDPRPHRFHEWRKRVKYLGYQLRILNALWPAYFDAWSQQFDELSEWLGDAHNLAMLQAHIHANPACYVAEDEREQLLALTTQRHAELEALARPLGRRLYAEEPAAFARRHAAYWQTWREEGCARPPIAEIGQK